MSLDLYIQIYPREVEYNAIETILELTKLVDEWNSFRTTWSSLNVKQYDYGNKCVCDFMAGRHILPYDKIINSVHNLKQDIDYTISICSLFPYSNTNSEKKAVKSYGSLDIQSWGSERFRGQYPFEVGYAQLVFNPANHYFFVMDQEIHNPDTKYQAYNNRVQENLNEISRLLHLLIEYLDPLSIKMFMDRGDKVPFNSHVTYFANPEAVIQDLHFIQKIWDGEYYTSKVPLTEYDPCAHEWLFNEMRTSKQRQELWEELSRLLPFLHEVTSQNVEDAWDVEQSVEDGWLDIKRINEEGAIVYSSSQFFNSFVSQFYLDVLEIAAIESEQS